MTEIDLSQLATMAEENDGIDAALAEALLDAPASVMSEILATASRLRMKHFGNKAILCSIINAKCGQCGEDCSFCAQSRGSDTTVESYGLKTDREILALRERIANYPVAYYSIVTSGKAASATEVERICQTIVQGGPGPKWCASLGCLDFDSLEKLSQAGLVRYHHNLEVAESFFLRICTTHDYADRIATIRDARRAGLMICAGGIFGVGESAAQRVELAMALAAERVESIPLNFLVALPGTRVDGIAPLEPLEILKIIAMFRLTNPKAEIRIAGGRIHLRRLQSMIFAAGANGMMVGDLLTVDGDDIEEDLQMVKDLGLVPG